MKLALPLAAGLALLPGDTLRHAPASGSSVVRSFEVRWDMALEDVQLAVMGQEIDLAMIGSPQVELDFRHALRVHDTYRSVEEGRITKLERRFDELGAEMSFAIRTDMGEEDVPDMVYASELEGRSVLFTWDESAESYSAAWADEQGGRSELLEGLVASMDFEGLLPAQEVEPGDSWSFAPEALEVFGSPGGNTQVLPDEADMGDLDLEVFEEMMAGFEEEMVEAFGELLEGELSATHAGAHEEHGEHVLVLTLAAETDGRFDFAPLIERLLQTLLEAEGVDPDEVDVTISAAELELELEAEGELHWNTRAQRPEAARLDGEFLLGVAFGASGEVEGDWGDVELQVEFGGSFSSACEVSAP